MRSSGSIASILLIALLVRVAFAELMIRRVGEQLPDSQMYHGYAQSLLQQGEYALGEDRARRAPGYPLFLASCWMVAGQPSARTVLWTQSLLGTATAAMVFLIGRHLASNDRNIGLASALLLTLEPYSIVLCSLELSETLCTTLLTTCVLLSCSFNKPGGFVRAFLLGAIAGFAVLVRPSCLLLLPIAAGFVLAYRAAQSRLDRSAVKTTFLKATAAALGAVVVLAPWWLRNAHLFGKFVPTTLNVGESLYDGICPDATGASDMRFIEQARTQENYRAKTEVERDRYWWDLAVAYAFRHPDQVVRLAVVKFGRFWSPWPNEPRFQRPLVLLATGVASLVIFIAAARGVGLLRRQPGFLLMLLVPVGYFCALHMVFVSSVRYRVPVIPLLCVLAGVGLAGLLSAMSRKEELA